MKTSGGTRSKGFSITAWDQNGVMKQATQGLLTGVHPLSETQITQKLKAFDKRIAAKEAEMEQMYKQMESNDNVRSSLKPILKQISAIDHEIAILKDGKIQFEMMYLPKQDTPVKMVKVRRLSNKIK